MEGTRTWCGVAFIPKKAVLFLGWVLSCWAALMVSPRGCHPGPHPPSHSRLTFDLSSQLRYQIVMNSLFLISIQKTVSREGPG